MAQVARWIILGVLFLVPFLPLYVSNELFFPFITGKGFAFRILTEVALAAYVVLAWIEPKYRPRFSWTLGLYAALVVWMAVANAFSAYPLKAYWSNFERMDGWVTLVHVFLFFVVAGAVLSADNLWRQWWRTFVYAGALVCLYGVLQLIGAFGINQGGVRVDATFGNAAYLAAYLLFVVAVAVWQALIASGKTRYVLGSIAALAAVIIFFTATRGAILGLGAGAGTVTLLWLFETRNEWKTGVVSRGAKVAVALFVAGAVAMGGFFLAKDSAWVASDPTLARISSISLSDLSTRFTIWGMALQGFTDHPIIGWGQEGFSQVFNTYYVPSLFQQESWFDRAHNTFLDWLIAGGAPALLLFLGLLATAVYAFYRRSVSRPERVLLVGALVAYAVQALVVFDNLFTYVPLAALLATAHALSTKPIPVIERLPVPSQETAATVIAPLVFVVAALVVWMVNIPGMRAGNDLVYALAPLPDGPALNLALFKRAYDTGSFASQEISEQLSLYAGALSSRPDVSPETKTAVMQFALERMAVETARIPHDARLHFQYAALNNAAGRYEQGLEEIDRAISLSPRKQSLYVQKGLSLWQMGRVTEAREAFTTAYEFDTSFSDPAIMAAVGHIITGDVTGGKDLLIQARGTTAVDSDALLYAYYQTGRVDDMIDSAMVRVIATNGDPQARFRLARTYAEVGRRAEARAEIMATMVAHPEVRAEGTALLEELANSI